MLDFLFFFKWGESLKEVIYEKNCMMPRDSTHKGCAETIVELYFQL